MTDLSHWMTKSEAAQRLQMSERTLERKCEKGEGPEMRPRPRPGLKPEPVYNPDDVERLAAPKAHVMPTISTPVKPPVETVEIARTEASAMQVAPLISTVLDRLASAVESAVAHRLQDTAPPQFPALYLTIPQASQYSGLSQALLRRWIREGKLSSMRDRSTKVRRADLDRLVGLAGSGEIDGIGEAAHA